MSHAQRHLSLLLRDYFAKDGIRARRHTPETLRAELDRLPRTDPRRRLMEEVLPGVRQLTREDFESFIPEVVLDLAPFFSDSVRDAILSLDDDKPPDFSRQEEVRGTDPVGPGSASEEEPSPASEQARSKSSSTSGSSGSSDSNSAPPPVEEERGKSSAPPAGQG